MIQTVRGPIESERLGFVLPHEHLVVDHSEMLSRAAPPIDHHTIERIISALEQARSHGVRTIVDCTPSHYGRYLDLMAAVSEAADVHIIASTGSFCEAWAPLPSAITSRDELALADEFSRELTEGAGSTLIRAGAIKAATSSPVTAQERKLLRAVGLASKNTDAPIVSHTSGGEGLHQLDIYQEVGVDLSRVMISHVGSEEDALQYAKQIVGRGAWVGFDKVGRHTFLTDERWVDLILRMRAAGHLDRVLLSHDVVMRFTGPDYVAAKTFEDYSYLPRVFLPRLSDSGLTDSELHQITVKNPCRWLTKEWPE